MDLYRKIYEAIDNGIQKALIIPNEQTKDVSVDFYHKKIQTDVKKEIINQYFSEFMNNSDGNEALEYYDKIINIYNENGVKYKLRNFEELTDIITRIDYLYNVYKNDSAKYIARDGMAFKYITGLNLKWVDMSDYISFILDDDSIIQFDQIDDYNKENILFLKFANDNLKISGNEVLIYASDYHYYSSKRLAWQTEKKQINKNILPYGGLSGDDALNKANRDMHGYVNCMDIIKTVHENPELGNVPIIEYCINLNVNGHQGYLPSKGQLQIMAENEMLLNYFFDYIGSKDLYLSSGYLPTSTEYSADNVWCISMQATYKKTIYNKQMSSEFIPVFK